MGSLDARRGGPTPIAVYVVVMLYSGFRGPRTLFRPMLLVQVAGG